MIIIIIMLIFISIISIISVISVIIPSSYHHHYHHYFHHCHCHCHCHCHHYLIAKGGSSWTLTSGSGRFDKVVSDSTGMNLAVSENYGTIFTSSTG